MKDKSSYGVERIPKNATHGLWDARNNEWMNAWYYSKEDADLMSRQLAYQGYASNDVIVKEIEK